MASWGWLRYAPWGEIARVAAKAASRAPEFVRELRKGETGSPATPPPPESVTPGLEQLRFELELVKTNLDRLRAHAEDLSQARVEQAKAVEASFRVLSARLRLLTWLVAAALAASLAALAMSLLR